MALIKTLKDFLTKTSIYPTTHSSAVYDDTVGRLDSYLPNTIGAEPIDDVEEEGAKDTITVSTAQDAHTMVFDNEKKLISIMDKEKNCSVEMATEEGNIKINAKSKITITVGDTIKVIMNGENGTVSIDCDKLQVKASKNAKIEADGNAKVSGKQVTVEASSALKLSSGGMVAVEGKPIKLG